jgi:hypothetical protein
MKSNSGINSGKQRGRVENLRAHQYKPGQSGNPKGRPPTRGLTVRLKAELSQVDKGGAVTEELLVKKLVRLALHGNLAAIRECFDNLPPVAPFPYSPFGTARLILPSCRSRMSSPKMIRRTILTS